MVPIARVTVEYDGQSLFTTVLIPADAHSWGLCARRRRSVVKGVQLGAGEREADVIRRCVKRAADDLWDWIDNDLGQDELPFEA